MIAPTMGTTVGLDEDDILSRIRGGSAQAEIAEELGIAASTLNEWLHRDPERSARARDAMAISAETWLDRGMRVLRDAERDQVEVARARALEQHYARRAAIRDPHRYADRVNADHKHSGSMSVALRAVTATDDELLEIARGKGKTA